MKNLYTMGWWGQQPTNLRPGIPWEYFNLISNGFLKKGETDEQKVVEGRQKYDAALAERILSDDKEKPELIVLAGWMHVFSPAFLDPIKKAGINVINLHPLVPHHHLREDQIHILT